MCCRLLLLCLFLYFNDFVRPLANLPPCDLRHVMIDEFLKNSTACTININQVYGEGSTTATTCSKWSDKFRSGDKSLEDEPGRGSIPQFEDSALLRLLANDNR
uniref:HTH_48 domain-containing protein n=1 Tax=Steinernema glaseri TaxID=37863 RepID=A0A1I7YEJ5_9BILA